MSRSNLQRTSVRQSKRKYRKRVYQTEDEYVGFASLPEQVHRKAVKKGFNFTLMVVGESGLGKSTLINSLFLTDIYKDRQIPSVEDRMTKTVEIEKRQIDIEERGVRLRLTVVDTPGYSDALNTQDCCKAVENFVDEQFAQYFKDESGVNRRNIQDSRVHCCLYFISPCGHGLKQVDVEFMKQLHEKVNIVPIIAKADTLTAAEVCKLKNRVLQEIDEHGIKIYEFPDCDSDEDEDFKQQDKELKLAIPFSVIGSNTVLEVNGKKIRGRLYPWGIVEVDNPKHCDFLKLRQMLISTHMQDLKDVTQDVHYENYRAQHISEENKRDLQRERKLKRESCTSLDGVVDADRLLQQKDEEIRRMQEMLKQMQEQLHVSGGRANGTAC
ncbi:septin-2 isoform X3 [Lingula anatina]|uniref:Septin n=1 Tax=Lingula anatina TaxID=7574 RepID=A0A1S3K1L7_LINAN|nr:septin-2 isoform X2 [Lingula anatina]XP_013416529.1 septin-2 isoform X3 [Lingula anatina]|eukprot:XP_013416528.1 septin-2 isoform X2 [Lingula anatina]